MSRYLAALLAVATIALVLPAADEPPKLLKPTPLAVNTDQNEDDPHICSNNLKLYFVRAGKDKAELFVSERKKTGTPWGKANPVADLKMKTASVRGPFLTPEGKFPQYLYFATDKDPEKKGEKGDNYDLYFLIKQAAGRTGPPRRPWSLSAPKRMSLSPGFRPTASIFSLAARTRTAGTSIRAAGPVWPASSAIR